MPQTTITMDSLKDDNVEDILLCLPSWASLGQAVRASDRFRRIASSPDFLRRFRARHALSSPRSFLGVFAPQRYNFGLPVFHVAGPARSDPGLVAVARSSDFLLASLEDDSAWRVHDCRNGRLLLSKANSLTIYDPISLRRLDICRPRPQDDPFSNAYISGANCLLDDGNAPLRVLSLQVDDRGSRLRAAEYDSRVREWRFHPWAPDAITPPLAYQTMYAADLVFWNHDGSTCSSSLMLDTRTMEFSMLPLPATIVEEYSMVSRYSIGETEDGRCCLVCVSNRLLQVWLLRENRRGGSKWEFEKEMPLSELLDGPHCDYHHVGKVIAGLVIVSAGNVGSCGRFHHYAIDLKNLSIKAMFSDLCASTVYPFQLPPWPPDALTPAKQHMLQTDIRKDTEKKQKLLPVRRSKRLCQEKRNLRHKIRGVIYTRMKDVISSGNRNLGIGRSVTYLNNG